MKHKSVFAATKAISFLFHGGFEKDKKKKEERLKRDAESFEDIIYELKLRVVRFNSLDERRNFLTEIEALRVPEAPHGFQKVICDLLCDRDGPLVWRGVIATRSSSLVLSWVPIIMTSIVVLPGR